MLTGIPRIAGISHDFSFLVPSTSNLKFSVAIVELLALSFS